MAPKAKTDGDGRARIAGVLGGLVDLYLAWDEPGDRPGDLVGTVNLEKGDGRFDVTVGNEQEATLAITVAGTPCIPAGYLLFLRGGQRGPVKEDADRGELRFSLRRSGRSDVQAQLVATGYLIATALFEPAAGTNALFARIDLQPESSLVVMVSPPEDGRYRLFLQSWSKEDRRWGTPRGGVKMPREKESSGHRKVFKELHPGRYRVYDQLTRAIGPTAEVRDPSEVQEIAFDLSHAGTASGRVVAPSGTELRGVRVSVGGDRVAEYEDRGDDPRRQMIPVAADGTFSFRHPGDRPLILRPVHPVLAPAASGGSATIDTPRDDIVLQLERTTEAKFRVPPETVQRMQGWWDQLVRVKLFKGDASGSPTAEFTLSLREGHGNFGGYPAGTWTLWIDLPGSSPLVLRDRHLGDGITDLGELPFSRGATLRVKVRAAPGCDPPRVAVWCRSASEPMYGRGRDSCGEPEVLVTGLGIGRFEVRVDAIMMGRLPESHVVESDGRSEIPLTFDAR